MNPTLDQNREKSILHTSNLIRLFEQKGYLCEEISRDKETIYLMKSDFSKREKVPASNPKVTVH